MYINMKEIKGGICNGDFKFLIICSRFNEFVSNNLLNSAISRLKDFGIKEDNISVIFVPGAFEIPLALKLAFEKKENKFDIAITLGAVIRGETPHFDFVCAEVSKGVSKISLDFSVPVIFGVLTTNNIDEAIERSGGKNKNKGKESVESAIEMLDVVAKIKEM